jgi:LPXTG-motif cell wall-anchored protein
VPVPTESVVPAPRQAATLRLEITKTLVGTDLITVGQYLTFTIQIRNTGLVTVTVLPLIDEYDPAVLQPTLARFQPAPDTSLPGRLDWRDLTDLPGFGDLPPGGGFTLTTVFRAIGISDTVINRARIEAAVGSSGAGGGPAQSEGRGAVQGGKVTIEKALIADLVRADAPTISFRITVRNDGAADLVRVPVTDTFDPAYLRFVAAVPVPNSADPATGTLVWDNILTGVGVSRLQPGQVVTATTSFTVLAPIDNLVVNRIAGGDVRDEFGNAVQAPRQADVRIRIIGVADTRPTATPIPAESHKQRTATPTPTSVIAPTEVATLILATAEATMPIGSDLQANAGSTPEVAAPTSLPRTGESRSLLGPLLVGLVSLLLGVLGFLRNRSRT